MVETAAAAAERARLIAMIDAYMEALTARDPGRLRAAPHLRYTEDSQAIAPGSGLWRTIRGRRPGGHHFVDVERGQVEHWTVIDEMGETAILSVRLKIEAQTIAEAETIVTRAGAFFEPDAVMEANPGFHRLLEPGERMSRAALIAAADDYFDAIERTDGSRVSVRDDCRRLVNGVVDSSDEPEHALKGEEHRLLGVSQQISEGHYGYIETLRDRRYPIVDVERGLAVCHVVFDHPGDLPRPGGDLPIKSPNSMLFTEVFKVVGGRIDEIWALGTAPLPYGSGSGW